MSQYDLNKIKLLVLDVDGVLTDGRVVLTPSGEEIKFFHVRDGSGMKYWKRCGGKLAIISGRASPAIHIRAKDLDVDAVRVGVKDKLPAYQEILRELAMSPEQTAAIGDDLPDLPILHACALPMAPADAVAEVKREAAHITDACGGQGCVREAIEWILRGAGKWDAILARYQSPAQGSQGECGGSRGPAAKDA